jgi:hypothetical protein
MVVHACNLSYSGESGRIVVQDWPRQKVLETPISTNKPGLMVCACDPNYTGSVGRRIVV